MTTRAVPGPELTKLHRGGRDREGILSTADGHSVRIGPTTLVRFRRRDGSLTPWVQAGDLYVNDDGAFSRRHLPLQLATGIRISALGALERMLLWKTAPSGAKVEEVWEGELSPIAPTGQVLVAWLDAWVREVALMHALPPLPGTADSDARKRDYLRWALGGKPLGTFHVTMPAQDASVTLDGAALMDALRDGVEVMDGIRWTDVMSAELQNLDGGKTLAGVAITSALVIALLPAAIVIRGGPSPSIGVRAPSHLGPSELPVRDDGAPSEGSTLSAPDMDVPHGDAERLFTFGARRRGWARLVATLDVGMDTLSTSQGRWATGASLLSLRFVDLIELGAGLRYATGNVMGVFRGGLHCELDARGRFAIPLAVELGKGGEVRFHFALDFGLRIRATENVSFGLHAFRPTFDRLGPTGRWSFVSGTETTFSF